MPIERLGKQREALHFSGEQYKHLIREYLESEGYSQKSDSSIEGHLADMVLVNIADELGKELWVECKATEISPSDTKFTSELLRYFIQANGKEGVEIRAYVRGIKSKRKFDKLLSKKHGKNLIPEWFAKALPDLNEEEQEILRRIGTDRIVHFFTTVRILIADPDWLRRVTKEKNRRNKISVDRYAEELLAKSKRLSEPIATRTELTTSLIELKFPSTYYRAITPKFKSSKKIYGHFEKKGIEIPPLLFFPEKQQVCMFCPFDEKNPLTPIIDKETISTVKLEEDEINEQNLHAVLNTFLRRIFWKKGLLRVSKSYTYYFPAVTDGDVPESREVESTAGEKLKQMVRVYWDQNNPEKINHILHYAVEMRPVRLWNKTYLQLRPTKVFSMDGKFPVDGKRKIKLEGLYRNPLYNRNSAKLLEVNFWQKFLKREDNYEREKEYWFDGFKFGELVKTISPVAPKLNHDVDQMKLVEFK